jgi:hypothetical protein
MRINIAFSFMKMGNASKEAFFFRYNPLIKFNGLNKGAWTNIITEPPKLAKAEAKILVVNSSFILF